MQGSLFPWGCVLTIYSILFHNQHGFLNKYDTSLAVAELVDKISASMDNKELLIDIFMDISKAFDTLIVIFLLQNSSNVESMLLQLTGLYCILHTDSNMFISAAHHWISKPCPVESYRAPYWAYSFLIYADYINIFLSNKNT